MLNTHAEIFPLVSTTIPNRDLCVHSHVLNFKLLLLYMMSYHYT